MDQYAAKHAAVHLLEAYRDYDREIPHDGNSSQAGRWRGLLDLVADITGQEREHVRQIVHRIRHFTANLGEQETLLSTALADFPDPE